SVLLAAAVLVTAAPRFRVQNDTDLSQLFEKREIMIPMRDGIRLNTEIYAPKNARDPLPFLLTRTPYGIGHDAKGFNPALRSSYKELADDGYIFVFQDIRGRYKSEGQFVMSRPPREKSDPKAIDESTDSNDSIEWLLKSVSNNNGRVGVLGISYGGWLTVMAMLDPHPAIKAVSEQASPADMFLGDDFHHNGAFRLSYGFEYAALLETSKTNTDFKFDRYDTYEWYLNLGALSNANRKYFHDKLPTWNDFVNHPDYDWFWRRQALATYLKQPTVPNLNVAGWWDQEDFYGPLKIYDLLEKKDSRHLNYLVVGPWNHGGWARGEGDKLGKINFETATGVYFRQKVQAPWFAYFLKDKGKLNQPEALTFQTGANQWMSYEQWPPTRSVTDRNLYFQSNGTLSFEPPPSTSGISPDAMERSRDEFDSYISDPAHPVPYRNRPIEPTYYPRGSGWYTWLLEDQRFIHMRPDVLSFETQFLREDVTVSGQLVAHLFASTSGTDSDWIVKLIDVYPEEVPNEPKMGGYQLMIANEVFRGRFRKSFGKPEAVAPNQVNEYVIDLHSNDHRFLKGHKIMVQVQSTWFPLIDRNPQKFVDNIFTASETDYQPATQRVYRSKRYPSHIILPVAAR
ncbi:MAG TPA: CocE/NonD family hydrolase, partial [Acidobacteriota bacterium]|nr:CocE/NonD family hydrolase [Acidobacteriota bacterium]